MYFLNIKFLILFYQQIWIFLKNPRQTSHWNWCLTTEPSWPIIVEVTLNAYIYWVQSQHSTSFFNTWSQLYFLSFSFLLFFILSSSPLPSPFLKKLNNKVSDILLTSPFFFLIPFFFSSFFFPFFSSYFSPHRLFPSFFIPFSMPPFYLVCPTNHLKCPAPFEHERTYCTGTQKTYLELC